MYSPENAYMQKNTLEEKPLSSAEEAVYEWYVNNPSSRSQRAKNFDMSNMDDFSSQIDSETIKKHRSFIRKGRESSVAKEKTQRAEIFEKMLEEEGNKNSWFGESCRLIPTFEYDDRASGIDIIAEWTDEKEPLRLGIDCTTSEKEEDLGKKIDRIRGKIKNKIVNKVRYFKDVNGKKGTIVMIPQVVLAIKKDTLAEMCKDIVTSNENKDSNILKNHFIQEKFRIEIIQQLEKQVEYIEYLENESGPNRVHTEIAITIKKIIAKIEEESEKKVDSLGDEKIQRALDELSEFSL